MQSPPDRQRHPKSFVALAISILLNSIALVALRGLVDAVAPASGVVSLQFFVHAFSHWLFWAGAMSFITGIFFWVQALKTIDLSVAYPTAASSYVLIALVSRAIFDEPITAFRIVGMLLISAGVVALYYRPSKGTTR